MLLHRHWLETELTSDELSMLIYIAQQNCEMNVDIVILQGFRLPRLIKKLQQCEAQVNEEGKEIYQSLRKKLLDFTNLQLL